MTALFTDEDLHGVIVQHLQARGHDVIRVIDDLRRRAPDPEVLLRAARLGRVLITHNHDDFLLLHRGWRIWSEAWEAVPRPIHSGILAVPQSRQMPPRRVADQIDAFLRSHVWLDNRFFALTETHGWRERL